MIKKTQKNYNSIRFRENEKYSPEKTSFWVGKSTLNKFIANNVS